MDYPRFCGCKGCRTCLLCESKLGIQQNDFYQQFKDKTSYVYCPACDLLYPGWDCSAVIQQHPHHSSITGLPFPGVLVQPDFVSPDEEHSLMLGIDEMPWDGSQSGRRKQNFGPKTNFKKQRLATGSFAGFPRFSQFVQQRFTEHALLSDFRTIEQCSLEYDRSKGASIDPHIDDCWIWGERIVTVSLLQDSVLTLTLFEGNAARYNLPLVAGYEDQLLSPLLPPAELERWSDVVVRLPMPARSLMVLYGAPRYQWEHCVLREDIAERRVCIAYRELTPPYLALKGEAVGESAASEKAAEELRKGAEVLRIAAQFWDHQQPAETLAAAESIGGVLCKSES